MRFGFGLGLTDRRPPIRPIATLARYYGTGLGQVPLHLAPEDAVLDASGNVTGIANKGGAGASFNAVVAGAGMRREGGMLNITSTALTADLTTPVEVVGTRMFVIAHPAAADGSYRYFGYLGSSLRIAPPQAIIHKGGSPAVTGTISSGVPTLPEPSLLEVQLLGGAFSLWVNGLFVGSAPFDVPSLLFSRIGRGNVAGAEYLGRLGDITSFITDGSPAMNARAAEIRRLLAAKHGIPLA